MYQVYYYGILLYTSDKNHTFMSPQSVACMNDINVVYIQ